MNDDDRESSHEATRRDTPRSASQFSKEERSTLPSVRHFSLILSFLSFVRGFYSASSPLTFPLIFSRWLYPCPRSIHWSTYFPLVTMNALSFVPWQNTYGYGYGFIEFSNFLLSRRQYIYLRPLTLNWFRANIIYQ